MRKTSNTKKARAETAATESTEATPTNGATTYWLLKTANTPKLGKSSQGTVGYQVLADRERSGLFIAITSNEGGGYFSRELVPFTKVDACIDAARNGTPIYSKQFAEAFVGRSSNNAGFMAAILRNEGLLLAADDAPSMHVVSPIWQEWQALLIAQEGEQIQIQPPVVPEPMDD